MAVELISIEVAYTKPDAQAVIPLDVPAGCTVEQAIRTSGILEQFPEIDLTHQKVGIYGQICALAKVVSVDDRIEIYRPLLQNPMDARRGRISKP